MVFVNREGVTQISRNERHEFAKNPRELMERLTKATDVY